MSGQLILNTDEEDEKLLDQINIVERFFVLLLNAALNPLEQTVFDRSLKQTWLKLIDVRPVGTPHGPDIARIYYLTDKGIARLREIRERNKIQVKLNG